MHGVKLIGVRANNRRILLGTAGTLDDARVEATFFVDDPRDTVQTVYLWDLREEQFRGWVNRVRPVFAALGRRRTDTLAGERQP